MVRAILNGRKTQTRRVLKSQPRWIDNPADCAGWYWEHPKKINGFRPVESWGENTPAEWLEKFIAPHCPYGQPGDRLWVREAWADCVKGGEDALGGMKYDSPWYRADADAYGLLGHDGIGPVYAEELLWRPSSNMPRWASRILLEITAVRIERLHDISEADAKAEGLKAFSKGGRAFKYGIPGDDGLPGQDDDGWPWAEWNTNAVAAFQKLWEQHYPVAPKSWDENPWVWVIEFRQVQS